MSPYLPGFSNGKRDADAEIHGELVEHFETGFSSGYWVLGVELRWELS